MFVPRDASHLKFDYRIDQAAAGDVLQAIFHANDGSSQTLGSVPLSTATTRFATAEFDLSAALRGTVGRLEFRILAGSGPVTATLLLDNVLLPRDTMVPVPSLTAAVPAALGPVPVTLAFSEPVTGLTASKVIAVNATVTAFTPINASTYTFTLLPKTAGPTAVILAAGAAQDAVGNPSQAAQLFFQTPPAPAPTFLSFDLAFRQAGQQAQGDVNGDSVPDLIAVSRTRAGRSRVLVFDGHTGGLLHSFLPFGVAFRGRLSVAAGDFDGDTLADIVIGVRDGGPARVRIFRGIDLNPLARFLAFSSSGGSMQLAAADVTGNGIADILALNRRRILRIFRGPNLTPLLTTRVANLTLLGGIALPLGG
jgi:hypothetical protein